MEGDDLTALREIWNKKLKESGFEDIEEVRKGQVYLKSWHSLYFHCRYTPEAFEGKQEYYRRASQFLYEYSFAWFPSSSLINLKEREVWRLHSEGKSLRDIETILRARGYKINKDSANLIVKKFSSIMWNYDRADSDS